MEYPLLGGSTLCGMIFLVQSANFGKGFLGPEVPMEVVNQFVEMCHQMRVLNNVREEEIGIPITYKQYPHHPHTVDSLTPPQQTP